MVSLPPGSALGRYRIVAQLGRGGMATVFRALDPALDRYVAVKVLPSYYTEDPTFIARFTHEAQTIAKLNHPNILRVYDFGDDKGFSYIVSELVTGGSLQERISGKRLSLDDILGYMRPLADALDYAHAQGIVHRDIKPANVLLDAESRPILADFGLARMLEAATRFTQAQQAMGTPEYMAPEQALGADADRRSDLYAMGIMVYQMYLGQTPFKADTPAATLMAHVHRPLPLPSALDPGISPRLEVTLLKALAKDPNDRFQSAHDLVYALALAASHAAAPVAAGGDATAVLDAVDLDRPASGDASTAVLEGAGTPAAAGGAVAATPMPSPVAAPASAGAPAPAGPRPIPPAARRRPTLPRRWPLVGAGVASTVVAAVAVSLLTFLRGGQPEATVEGTALIATTPGAAASGADATPAALTVVVSPTAVAAPTMTLAEAVATLGRTKARIAQAVITLRGLTLDDPIEPQLRTREQLESITRGMFRRTTFRNQVFRRAELFKTLDLMDEKADLEEMLIGIQLQQVYALFDDETGLLYVLSDAAALGPVEELAYASAYTAGAQQRLFDISALRDAARQVSADALRAVTAFIGGDVAQLQMGYVQTVMSEDQARELAKPLEGNLLAAAPDAVRKDVLLPQREGSDFVASLFATTGSWDAVNRAYQHPPASTEQVLHPDKYLLGEAPVRLAVPDVSEGIGKGWAQIRADTMGEFLLRTYLETHLDEADSARAAAGWGGDAYSLLSGPEGERLFISLIAWDSEADGVEFFQAYQEFVRRKYEGITILSKTLGENARKWVAPDHTFFLGLEPAGGTLLIIGDREELVGQALNGLTGTP